MKILLVNTSDRGGAANACIRLHKGLLAQGSDSTLLLADKQLHIEQSVKYIPKTQKLSQQKKIKQKTIRLLQKTRLYPNPIDPHANIAGRKFNLYPFSLLLPGQKFNASPFYKAATIINLHWVHLFLDWQSFFEDSKKAVVWTLHDMQAFTGGCFHSFDCPKYQNDCSDCPQLKGAKNPDYAAQQLQRKQDYLANFDKLHIVTPSQWLMTCSQKSTLFNRFPHYNIKNSVDTSCFQAYDRNFCRHFFKLPEDQRLILFVAGNGEAIKGYNYLKTAWEKLPEYHQSCKLFTVGSGQYEQSVISIGPVYDERLMAMLYSAADLLVVPSLAENLPNVIAEALCCGTPVIGFPTGGIPEMIIDQENGYLCPEISADALAETILKYLKKPEIFDQQKIINQAVDTYDLSVQANAYQQLYQSILKQTV